MWLLCYQSMLKFGLWNLDWWFRIFHFLKLTPFVKEGKGGCLIEFNQIFMLYILGWVFFCSIHYGQYFRLYNVYLCSKPSKTVGNFNTIIVCRQIDNFDKRQRICWCTVEKHLWEIMSFLCLFTVDIYTSHLRRVCGSLPLDLWTSRSSNSWRAKSLNWPWNWL